MKNQLLTLSIIQKGDRVLLGMKKQGFGKGWWNGFGGKVEEGEELDEAAKREIDEEIKVKVNALEERGVLYFSFLGDPKILEVHIYSVTEFKGEPQETKEMRPVWFEIKNIPYHNMWPADSKWLPVFLEGKKFEGRIDFDEDKNVLGFEINEIKLQEIKK